jgi:hypothetical protein
MVPVLTADQRCNIVCLNNKLKRALMMMKANIDPYDLNVPALLNYLKRLELVDNLHKKARQEDDASIKC